MGEVYTSPLFLPIGNFKKEHKTKIYMEIVNKLSPELAKIVNEARPKRGQIVYFQSLRPQAGGTSVRNIDRIFDPWAKNPDDDKLKGDFVDIAYVTGQTPARGGMPAMHNYGRIQFTKSAGNMLGLSSNNKGEETLFTYLFLCNSNKLNMDKPWYAPSENQQPLFEMQLPEMDAKSKNDLRRRVRLAGDKIDNMPESKLRDFAISLDMPGINEFSGMEEVRNQLYLISEKNPDKIMNMDKDVNLAMKLVIREALKYGIWEEDKALKLFVWPETKDPVFLMTPGQDLYAETIKYLLGNGVDTLSMVQTLTKAAENKPSNNGKSSNKKFNKVPEFSEVKDD